MNFSELHSMLLIHVEETVLFELLKEGFACLGMLWSLLILIDLTIALKRWVKPAPPKQFFQ